MFEIWCATKNGIFNVCRTNKFNLLQGEFDN